MNTLFHDVKDAERALPLLREIRREIRERTQAAARIEARIEALQPTRHAHLDDLNRLESELSGHRRELRRIERELGQLGCRQDDDRPLRILIAAEDGELVVDGDLSKTSIRRAPLQPHR